MGKFIIGTFAMLTWAFYVMSGGADFVPETQMAEAPAPKPEVTRAAMSFVAVSRPVAAIPAAAASPASATATVEVAAPAASMTPAVTAPVFEGAEVSADGIEPTLTSLSAPAPAAVGSPDLSAVREVAARAVNMRAGPDTSYEVLDTLPQGTQAEVVESDGAGWVRVRITSTGQMGWMAERLLTAG